MTLQGIEVVLGEQHGLQEPVDLLVADVDVARDTVDGHNVPHDAAARGTLVSPHRTMRILLLRRE